MTSTLGQLIDTHGADVLEHLDRDLEVPVLSGIQMQGDLAVIEAASSGARGSTVPAAGIAVIKPVGSGHEHRLFAGEPGTAVFAPDMGGGQAIGVLGCTAPAYIAHPEHGYLGIAPGRYELRRQREQSDEERLVAD